MYSQKGDACHSLPSACGSDSTCLPDTHLEFPGSNDGSRRWPGPSHQDFPVRSRDAGKAGLLSRWLDLGSENQADTATRSTGGRIVRWRYISWITATAAIAFIYGFVHGWLARRYETAAFRDGVQLLMLAALVVNHSRPLIQHRPSRRFWIFMLLWALGWLCGTLIWSCNILF